MSAETTWKAHTWFRKNGVPLVVPRKQRIKETPIRSLPILLWLSLSGIAHIISWPFVFDIATNATDQNIGTIEISESTYVLISLITIILIPLFMLAATWFIVLRIRKLQRTQQAIIAAALIPFTIFVYSPGLANLLEAPSLAANWFFALLLVLFVLFAVFLGADALLRYELRQTYWELWSLAPMIAKALPTVMIAVLFIFFNADVWKVANKLTFTRTLDVCTVLLGLSALVAITTAHEKTRHMLGGRTGTNLEEYTQEQYREASKRHGQEWQKLNEEHPAPKSQKFLVLEWLNFLSVPIGAQLIQAMLFSTLVSFFFLGFGTLAIPDETVTNWLGEPASAVVIANLTLPVSSVLLKVSILLGAFAGLSFVASTSSDERYAKDFLEENLQYLQDVVMIRNIYWAAQRS